MVDTKVLELLVDILGGIQVSVIVAMGVWVYHTYLLLLLRIGGDVHRHDEVCSEGQ